MKKLLFMILPVFSLQGDIRFSFVENKYYTHPEDSSVDEIEYDLLACIMSIMNTEFINAGIPIAQRYARIDEYLITQNTPTSLRLLEDLRKTRQ